jgi:hypothetical protein
MIEFQRQWDELCTRWGRDGYEALSSDERIWLNVVSLMAAILNGGVISYFYNSGADTYDDCLEALERLGAFEVRAEVERIGSLFPGGVSKSLEERNAVINAWGGENEAVLAEADELLMPLMDELETELAAFIVASGLARRENQ